MRENQVPAAQSSPAIVSGFPAIGSAARVSSQEERRTLLWVDDSGPLLSLYKAVFEGLGFSVIATSSPNDALEYASSRSTDVAILDYDMPEMNGGTLAVLLKNQSPMLPVILYSANAEIPYSARSKVNAVLRKDSAARELAFDYRLSHTPGKTSR